MTAFISARRRDFRLLIVSTLAVIALASCAPQTFRTVDALEQGIENRRIVLMPVDIELGLLNASGITEPRADWTEIARKHVHGALERQTSAMKATIVLPASSDPVEELNEKQIQILKLANAVNTSIALHEYLAPMALPSKKGTFDWTIGPEARALKDKYDADYALFVFLRDTYSSTGRVAIIMIYALIGVSLPGGIQQGTASLVDLNTGNVVWFNQLFRTTGDLRTDKAATESVEQLLTGFPA